MKVVVVPGMAVSRYLASAADALRARGYAVDLWPGPGQPGGPADLRGYGERLAEDLRTRADPVVLVGASVGCQAAAVAAARTGCQVGLLVLISPTVDPDRRSALRLLSRWLVAGSREPPGLVVQQVPDWVRAATRIPATLRSTLRVRIERYAERTSCRVVVVHAEADLLVSHAYAADLAARYGGRLIVVPGGSHSWPARDERRFADLIEELTW